MPDTTQRTNRTLSLSIFSGKGGVGKTNIALNLGYALHSAGHSLLLMDCDLGLANIDILLGITPEHTLMDLLQTGVRVEDVVLHLEPGLDFLPAATGLPELVELDEDVQTLLLQKLNDQFSKYDFLLLDLGAGITPTVLTFAAITRHKLMVITPEPTSLTDGYAMIKILSSQYGCREFDVVVNMAHDQKEGGLAFTRIDAACRKFLGFGLTHLGTVRQDKAVLDAVRQQVPLVKASPRAMASQDIMALASKLRDQRHRTLARLAGQPILDPLPTS